MSRLRKIDRQVLEELVVLDSDDQAQVIEALRDDNVSSYRLYCYILMALETIAAAAVVVGVRPWAHAIPVALSLMLATAEKAFPRHRRYVRSVNVALSMLLALTTRKHSLVHMLAVGDLALTVYLDRLFVGTARSIEALEGLKYKFKTV